MEQKRRLNCLSFSVFLHPTLVGLKVNPEKTKCMLMSRCKKAGQMHGIDIANKSLEECQSSSIWEQH
jgi:hypothetical protein